jgi:hypothetical protein
MCRSRPAVSTKTPICAVHGHQGIVKLRVQFADTGFINLNPFAQNGCSQAISASGKPNCKAENNRHRSPDKSPEDTRDQELTADHFVVGAKNVSASKNLTETYRHDDVHENDHHNPTLG